MKQGGDARKRGNPAYRQGYPKKNVDQRNRHGIKPLLFEALPI